MVFNEESIGRGKGRSEREGRQQHYMDYTFIDIACHFLESELHTRCIPYIIQACSVNWSMRWRRDARGKNEVEREWGKARSDVRGTSATPKVFAYDGLKSILTRAGPIIYSCLVAALPPWKWEERERPRENGENINAREKMEKEEESWQKEKRTRIHACTPPARRQLTFLILWAPSSIVFFSLVLLYYTGSLGLTV